MSSRKMSLSGCRPARTTFRPGGSGPRCWGPGSPRGRRRRAAPRPGDVGLVLSRSPASSVGWRVMVASSPSASSGVPARGAEVDALGVSVPAVVTEHGVHGTPPRRPASPGVMPPVPAWTGLSPQSGRRRRPRRAGSPVSAPGASSSSQIHPSPYGSWLIRSGAVGERVVDRRDRARHRRVDLRHRLGRLDLAELPARLDLGSRPPGRSTNTMSPSASCA